MIKNQCEHKWEKISDLTRNEQNIVKPATFLCKGCSTELTASEVFQLEALENQTKAVKHLTGFQKWIWIVSVSLSALAVIIAFLAFFFNNPE